MSRGHEDASCPGLECAIFPHQKRESSADDKPRHLRHSSTPCQTSKRIAVEKSARNLEEGFRMILDSVRELISFRYDRPRNSFALPTSGRYGLARSSRIPVSRSYRARLVTRHRETKTSVWKINLRSVRGKLAATRVAA